MTSKMTFSWIIYSCLIFGSGILCDIKLERRQAVSSCTGNTEDKVNCTNGVSIESSRICDGQMDCSDRLNETNQMCSQNEYGTNMTTDCSRVYTKQELIHNGQKALFGTAPWNVGIYKFKERNSNYRLICGGSIISSNLVVSAAHCFWKKRHTSNKIFIEDSMYKIVVGKYDRNISIIDNNFTQIMDVDIVYLKEDYNGDGAFYAEDIAIIKLKNRISYSSGVAPICIDWNGKYNEVNGDQGKIVGWGRVNNSGISSPILLEASLPYIDRTSCRNMNTNVLKPYVSLDKFCACSALEQEVDVVNGGVGLSFFHSNTYYLTGVASVEVPYINNSIAVFTDVKYHIQWIRALYNRYRRRAGLSCSVNAKEKFYCSNGESIKKLWICDDLKDCSDGSDETNELCARNENGTNMTTVTK